MRNAAGMAAFAMLVAAGLVMRSSAEETDALPERIEIAIRLWRDGNSADALKVMDGIIADAPEDPAPWRLRGRMREAVRDFEGADADLSVWIARGDPTAADRHIRGACRYRVGRIDAALADWNRELQIDPSRAPGHWQRGIALHQAGRFAEGRAQFELHRTVNPDDVENALWHFLCVAAEDGPEAAREALLETSGDRRRPMAELFDLYRSGAPDAERIARVEAAARRGSEEDSDERRTAMFYADLYLGLYHEALGDAENAALRLGAAARAAEAAGSGRHYMHDVAVIHMKPRISGLTSPEADAAGSVSH